MTLRSVDDAMALAREAGLDRLDAQLLVGHVLAQSRAWVIAHGDAALPAEQVAPLRTLIERRAQGEPLAYLVGHKDFAGLALQVDARVLVPRPDTETLVDWARELLGGIEAEHPRVIDLGTGSGAIALAMKAAFGAAHVTAVDASAEALAVARANGERLHLTVDWHEGDWWQPVADQRFHLALSNPPYIAAGDPHLTALTHEPIDALVSGRDGLDALRRIVAGAPAHVMPGGWLVLEHGYDQSGAVASLLVAAGFKTIQTRRDLSGVPRCTGGRL